MKIFPQGISNWYVYESKPSHHPKWMELWPRRSNFLLRSFILQFWLISVLKYVLLNRAHTYGVYLRVKMPASCQRLLRHCWHGIAEAEVRPSVRLMGYYALTWVTFTYPCLTAKYGIQNWGNDRFWAIFAPCIISMIGAEMASETGWDLTGRSRKIGVSK